VVSFTARPLYPHGKGPWYPLDRRLGGPRAVLDAVDQRKIPSPHRKSNPRTPIVQPVALRQCTGWMKAKPHVLLTSVSVEVCDELDAPAALRSEKDLLSSDLLRGSRARFDMVLKRKALHVAEISQSRLIIFRRRQSYFCSVMNVRRKPF